MVKSIIPTKINFYSISITLLLLFVAYIIYDNIMTKKEYYKQLKIESMDNMGENSIHRNINYGNEPEYVNANPMLPNPQSTTTRTTSNTSSNTSSTSNTSNTSNNLNHNVYDYMNYSKNRRETPESQDDEPLLTRKEFNQFIKNLENKKCPPCPPCARCPEPSFECKKVPNYSSTNVSKYVPRPVLADFSQFAM